MERAHDDIASSSAKSLEEKMRDLHMLIRPVTSAIKKTRNELAEIEKSLDENYWELQIVFIAFKGQFTETCKKLKSFKKRKMSFCRRFHHNQAKSVLSLWKSKRLPLTWSKMRKPQGTNKGASHHRRISQIRDSICRQQIL